jgi:hypothetical protein
MALARVRWFPESEGGRPAPPPGPTYASTAVFVLGGDSELIPDWPAGGEHFSVMIDFDDLGVADEGPAKVEFMARSLVADRLAVGSTFLVMEGRRVVAEARVTEVFDDAPWA